MPFSSGIVCKKQPPSSIPNISRSAGPTGAPEPPSRLASMLEHPKATARSHEATENSREEKTVCASNFLQQIIKCAPSVLGDSTRDYTDMFKGAQPVGSPGGASRGARRRVFVLGARSSPGLRRWTHTA